MKFYGVLIAILLIGGGKSIGQTIPLEAMAGTENYWYQHVLARSFSETSRFGFFHVSTLHIFYENDRMDEIMSQSYLTYRLTGSFFLQAGSFYATGPGFSPSVGVQFVKQLNDLFFLLVPRIDVKRNGSWDALFLLRYRPRLTDQLKVYSHIQLMSNYSGGDHNRSYQNFWLGLEAKKLQFGLALNLDEYGRNYKTYYNPGIFIRKEL